MLIVLCFYFAIFVNEICTSAIMQCYEIQKLCWILWKRIHPRPKLRTRDISNGLKTKHKLRGNTSICVRRLSWLARVCACAWIRRETFKVFPNFCPHAPPRIDTSRASERLASHHENIGQDSSTPGRVLWRLLRPAGCFHAFKLRYKIWVL